MTAPKNDRNNAEKAAGKRFDRKEDEQSDAMPDEQDTDIIELTDEEGVTEKFEHLATLEMDGKNYLVLGAPDAPDDEDLEVEVLRIETDEDGADIYVSVDDDDEAEKVFGRFVEMLDDYDIVDGNDVNDIAKEVKDNEKKQNGKNGK